jgi:sugar O-acyltransferase (sialic acid O-acetyltransferase NeuD family)
MRKSEQVILAGNAIAADILFSYLADDSRYHVVGLTVDDQFADQGGISDLQTVPISRLLQVHRAQDCVVIMAMGYSNLNRNRESMYLRLREMGYAIATYVHPDARVYTQQPLGEGCVVLPSAVIEPHVRVGENTTVWCNVTLAHHCCVAEHCWVASGAVISGQARIDRNSFIGVNATVVNEVIVGEYNIIGGGALVTKNTKASTVHLARSGEEHRFSSQDYDEYIGV